MTIKDTLKIHGLTVSQVSVTGATVIRRIPPVNPERRIPGPTPKPEQAVKYDVSWHDLVAAARQDNREMRGIYSAVLAQARGKLAVLPRNQQGLRVIVGDGGTGGAAAEVGVYDASGAYRRDLMHAGEGGQHPHAWMAHQEADEIARRLGLSGVSAP